MADPMGGLPLPEGTERAVSDLAKIERLTTGQQLSMEAGRFRVIETGSRNPPGIDPEKAEEVLSQINRTFESLNAGLLSVLEEGGTFPKELTAMTLPGGGVFKAATLAVNLLGQAGVSSDAADATVSIGKAILTNELGARFPDPSEWVEKTCPEFVEAKDCLRSIEGSQSPGVAAVDRVKLCPTYPGGTATGSFRVLTGLGGDIGLIAKPARMGMSSSLNPGLTPFLAYNLEPGQEDQLEEASPDAHAIAMKVAMGTHINDYRVPVQGETVRERAAYMADRLSGCDWGTKPTALAMVSHPLFDRPRPEALEMYRETRVLHTEKALLEALAHAETMLLKGIAKDPSLIKSAMTRLRQDTLATLWNSINYHLGEAGLEPLEPSELMDLMQYSQSANDFEKAFLERIRQKNEDMDPADLHIGLSRLNQGSAGIYLRSVANIIRPMTPTQPKLLHKLLDDVRRGGVTARPQLTSLQQWQQGAQPISAFSRSLTAGMDAVDEKAWDDAFMDAVPAREWEKLFFDIGIFSLDRNDSNVLVRNVSRKELQSQLRTTLRALHDDKVKANDLAAKLERMFSSSPSENDTKAAIKLAGAELHSLEAVQIENALEKIGHMKANGSSEVYEFVLIDHGLIAPELELNDRHHQKLAFWMGIPQSKDVKLHGVRRELVMATNVETIIEGLKADQRAHANAFRDKNTIMSDNAYDLLRVTLLVQQVAAEERASLYDAGTILYGQRGAEVPDDGSGLGMYGHHQKKHGNEIEDLYNSHIEFRNKLIKSGETEKQAQETANKRTKVEIRQIFSEIKA